MREIDISSVEDTRTIISLEIGNDGSCISKDNADKIVDKFKDHKYVSARIGHEKFVREYDFLEVYVRFPNIRIESKSDVSSEMNYNTSYTLGHE